MLRTRIRTFRTKFLIPRSKTQGVRHHVGHARPAGCLQAGFTFCHAFGSDLIQNSTCRSTRLSLRNKKLSVTVGVVHKDPETFWQSTVEFVEFCSNHRLQHGYCIVTAVSLSGCQAGDGAPGITVDPSASAIYTCEACLAQSQAHM